jgi:deoxyribodipyrimidine photo-lyase
VFTICADQWRAHDWSAARVDLLLRSLQALSESLAQKRVPLKVITTPRFAGVPEALATLADAIDCDALYFSHELEWNERRRDAAVAARFRADGRRVRIFDDLTIVEPGAVRTQQGTWYTQFTPFKRAWLAALGERGAPAVLRAPRPQPSLSLASDPVPTELPGFPGVRRPDLYPAGEGQALRKLRAFARRRMHDYGLQRDHPGVEGTSGLSPYLALGVLSARQCLGEVIDLVGPGRDAWLNELIWREFYKHLLVGFPRLSKGKNFRSKYDGLPWENADDEFEAWCEGRTGYPLVDAGMRQLLETGWMHNRLRMVCAMFLSKHLLVDWRRGERHFMRHLVDGDLAANNGGWQWSASTGTDAQPYFRVFNPWLQSKRFDPEGAYTHRFVPELAGIPAKALHDPVRLARALVERGVDYPPPIVDHRQARARAIQVFKAV